VKDRNISAAPDYTNAALTMLGVNLMWIFALLWALWGFLPTLLLGAVLNHAISRYEAIRG
jgi:uncharacterized membrane protein